MMAENYVERNELVCNKIAGVTTDRLVNGVKSQIGTTVLSQVLKVII